MKKQTTPIRPETLLSGIPAARRRRLDAPAFAQAFFIESPAGGPARRAISPLGLPGLDAFLALRRTNPFWYRPLVGKGLQDWPAEAKRSFVDVKGTPRKKRPAETHFLLWRRQDGLLGLCIPLADRDCRAYLRRADDGLELVARHDRKPAEPRLAAFVACAFDPFQLVEDAAAAIAERLPAFRLRRDKAAPAFLDLFGWCTWDAFYKEIDARKVAKGLESFRQGGVQPGFLMIDDGWQSVANHRWLRFEPDPKKFPKGLSPLVAKAKRDYGVRLVGVWHALEGYWAGVDPKSKLGRRYQVRETPKPSACFDGWGAQFNPDERGYVDRHHIERLYQDFYAYLRSQGVDMTKVDNQAMLEFFVPAKGGRVAAMAAYQRGLQGASQTWFQGNLINCMSNSNDVAMNLAASAVWRNSDDFYPRRPDAEQARHVADNALNNVWSSAFVVPDWDMFQSAHPRAEFHAMARAVSGGPVYVSDKVGQHDFKLLSRLTLSGGRALRGQTPALPTEDCLFTDFSKDKRLLKVVGRNGPVATVGLFNCLAGENAAAIEDRIRPADTRLPSSPRFALYSHREGLLGTCRYRAARKLRLDSMQSDILTVSPVENRAAPIGLIDKYNSAAAIEGYEWLDPDRLRLFVADGGQLALYAERGPKRVVANGKPARTGALRRDGNLATLRLPPGQPWLVELRF